ncbi:MAG: heparinase [Pseudomonadaceae bacterium]|nr:heparinase [Pseudomonadaceae bacterium]
MSFKIKATTALSLGLPNLYRALSYRLGVKFGLNPVRRLTAATPVGALFSKPSFAVDLPVTGLWKEQAKYFGAHPIELSGLPPNWAFNPLNNIAVKKPDRPWWLIPDFDPAVGDIKVIWEASRFDWVLSFAQEAATGSEAALNQLNLWLEDWLQKNPPYYGPNWKCGQEASIRVMHLAMAALILGQANKPLPALLEAIELHLQRIEPTIKYAIAQDNNHGTSEAAALYIGGSWLLQQGKSIGRKWQQLGQKWLENRAQRLVGLQGSFSQYSLNYHRVMLDTFCMVEVWRRYLDLPVFSKMFYQRSLAATDWLFHFVSPETGDAPNLGANDGARLLPLTDTDYRDYRPTVQLAMVLFAKQRAYAQEGEFNLPVLWLGLELPENVAAAAGTKLFDDGGFAVLRRDKAMAMLRYPRFRFRPVQTDALHVDLWLEGENLLRDAGSYSYNTAPELQNYFPGTTSHNTIEFDARDQMPRISRFLFGAWLKTNDLKPIAYSEECTQVGASYTDWQGATHMRHISLSSTELQVQDSISGFKEKAVLRWRLAPGEWRVEGHSITNGEHRLAISAAMPIVRFELIQGWESRYYLQKTHTPVLEVEVHQLGSITTDYCWAL